MARMLTKSFCRSVARVVFVVSLICALSYGQLPAVSGADWPQILGPNRDGSSQGTSLSQELPQAGLKPTWSHAVGQGFAGASVVDEKVVVFHRVDAKEVVECLKLNDGSVIWKQTFPSDYLPRINPDAGPRSVPVIQDGIVVVLGAGGDLRCLDFTTGKQKWSVSLKDEFRADEGYFGFGSTPVVTDGKVISVIGGRRGPAVAAFDLENGKQVWTSGQDEATYVSPILVKSAGDDPKQYLVSVNRTQVYLIEPDSGEIAQQFEFGIRSTSVCAALPIATPEGLFLTASYGVGARAMTWSNNKLQQVWSNDDSISSQYPTPVYHDGHLYGTHGREDIGGGEFRCIDAKTGEVKWSADDLGMSHVILVGDELVITTVEGELVIAAATPEGFKSRYRTKLFDTLARALPALSNGHLIVRSNAERGDGELKCFRIGSGN